MSNTISVSTYHVEKFRDGKITFAELAGLYVYMPKARICADVGFQFPDKVVSVRHVDEGEWPFDDHQAIRAARMEYDAGQVELASGREMNHFVLYRFPRKKLRRNHLNYFNPPGWHSNG